MRRTIEYTDDGSATLFVRELNEHYHSTKGARSESQHIFIDMGLKYLQNPQPRILEVGFGTGLNAFLSLLAAHENNRTVHYTTLELYPLEWELVAGLNYSDSPLFKHIHTAPWEEEVEIAPHFTLLKKNIDFTGFQEGVHNNSPFDIVYFDAFAPEKQPEMWTQQLFDTLFRTMAPGAVLTSYCAKGVVRRRMQEAGFTVERLPGPPGGKREILRATKNLL